MKALQSKEELELIIKQFFKDISNKKKLSKKDIDFLDNKEIILKDIKAIIDTTKTIDDNTLVDTTTLLVICKNIKDTLEKIKKILNNYNMKSQRLENYLTIINSLSLNIKTYGLRNNDFALMMINYRDNLVEQNDIILKRYNNYLDKWILDNNELSHDYTLDFESIITSSDFKTLYLKAMKSSYAQNFVKCYELNTLYDTFMEKYVHEIEKYILYVSLTKGKKSYMSNYFRIALNIFNVEIIGDFDKKASKEMMKSYLLIIFLHESFHFIYRLNKNGMESDLAFSPKTQKVKEIYPEIGVDIILYIFGTEYITFITPESSSLLNDLHSWESEDTNFKVFDLMYISNGELIRKESKENRTGLKFNISKSEIDNVWDINTNDSIRYYL